MADRMELFKRLCAGAEFSREQLNQDMDAVHGHRWSSVKGRVPDLTALDFFGDSACSTSSNAATAGKGRKRCKPNTEAEHETEQLLPQVKRNKLKRTRDSQGKGGPHGQERRRPKKHLSEGEGETLQLLLKDDFGEDGSVEEDVEIEEEGSEDDGKREVEEIVEERDPSEEESSEGVSLFTGQSPLQSGLQAKAAKRRRKKKSRSQEKSSTAVQVDLQRQEASAVRNAHRIHVTGPDVPDAVESFQELAGRHPLPPYLLRNIESAGYALPTPIQMQAIPLMLQNREVLACAPTGSGKTAAFIFPLVAHLKSPKRVGFRAVILAPTRELAQQTYRECVRLSDGSGLKVHVLTKAKASANTFGIGSTQRFDILIATPNRLVHMLSQQPPAISLQNVEWLILDEADKLFEDGVNSFREQLSQIYTACDSPSVRHALFSATLGSGVEEFTRAHFDSPVRVIVGLKNSATDAVQQELLFVGQEAGKLIAMRNIIKKGFKPPVLVFVQSIERAKELFHELIYDGINVEVMHAERTQAQRDNIVKAFRAGKVWVLICTDLMGRGMDFRGVNLVVNYDFPTSAISYIHRVGRTGRAGRAGRAVTFFTEDDTVNLRSIANVMRSSGCDVPDWMLQLKKTSKKTRKKLVRKPTKRSAIKSTTKYDLQRVKRKRDMIRASKSRKTKAVTLQHKEED